MNCAETQRLLDGYLDDELDLRSALEVEEHLAACAQCGAEERGRRELRERVRANLTRHALPEALEQKLRDGFHAAQAPVGGVRPEARPARRWRSVAVALLPAAAAAALLVVAGPGLLSRSSEARIEEAVIAAHVRSLLANHLTDVASSDQHTVKPWFQGKLDYSVPATDWSAEGFALAGGRLDYVEDAPAAALVYRRRQHVVNLFVWPSRSAGEAPLRHLISRGYGAFRWAKDGMNYWAVSDLNDAELQEFVALVRGAH